MDGQTERCLHCGATVTVGRFPTTCGARRGPAPTTPRLWPGPTDTAERIYEPPAPAYAGMRTLRGGGGRSAYAATPETAYLAPDRGSGRQAPGPGLWVGVVGAMVLVLALGGFLLLRGAGGGDDQPSATQPIVPKLSDTPTADQSTPVSTSPSASSSAPAVAGPPANVAGFAQVTAPRHAPAGVDFAGQPVTYVAPNMVDGRNDTCWRTSGDATGTVLTFRLDQPTELSRVGLVNGYSKIAYAHGRPFDWYLGNRRVLSVEWIFDDGTTVDQQFAKIRGLQQRPIKPVTTSVVQLRITAVSPPGKGRAARDETAISEVFLQGRTTV
jgi:hypothetical protein